MLATVGCQRARPRDTLVLLNESPLGRLDPRFAITSWDVRVSRLIAPGLVVPGEALAAGGGLADTLEALDPLTWEASLSSTARFSNGAAVTPADVVYTFESLLDPTFGSPYRSALAEVLRGVEVRPNGRVRFHLKVPRASFTSDLHMGVVARPQITPPQVDFMGAGPYQLKQQTGDRVVLAANPHTPTPPAMNKLVVRTIRDDNARIMAVFGGSGDAIFNGVTPQVLQTVQARADVQVLFAPSATVTYVGFNLHDPVLAHRKVRRALAMSIDRARLVQAKLAGQAAVAESLLDAANPFFAHGLPPLVFDPQAAAALLDEAGFPDPDGPGPLPRFALVWKTSNNRFRLSLVQAMARQLAAVGVAVDVRAYEFATFMHDVRNGNFQLFTLQMSDVLDPDWLRSALHSQRIPSAKNHWVGLNRFRFDDPTVDALLEAASVEANLPRRRDLYRKVQEQVAERLPCLPLWHEHNVLVLRRDIEGVSLPYAGGLQGLLLARRRP